MKYMFSFALMITMIACLISATKECNMKEVLYCAAAVLFISGFFWLFTNDGPTENDKLRKKAIADMFKYRHK